MKRYISLALISLLLSACGANSTSTAPAFGSIDTSIVGRTEIAGKGIPFGRSDSSDPYMRLKKVSMDSTYGYTAENPIKVGIKGNPDQGPDQESAYLNALRGSKGEAIEYERLGSCCHFSTPNGIMNTGLLDVFIVSTTGKDATKLYLNMYDPSTPLAPKGFTIRK